MFENEIVVDSLWLEVCNELKDKLGESRFATWIEVLKPICYEDHKLMVLCQSNYIKTFINGHFKDYIEDAINNQLFPIIKEKTELLPVVATDEIYLEAIKNSRGQASFFSKSGEKGAKKGKLKKISSSNNSLTFSDRFLYSFSNLFFASINSSNLLNVKFEFKVSMLEKVLTITDIVLSKSDCKFSSI